MKIHKLELPQENNLDDGKGRQTGKTKDMQYYIYTWCQKAKPSPYWSKAGLCGLTSCCSVSKPCSTLCHPTDCCSPGFPVPHHLLEFAPPSSCPLCRCCHFKKVVLKWQRCVVTQPELLRSSEFPTTEVSKQRLDDLLRWPL